MGLVPRPESGSRKTQVTFFRVQMALWLRVLEYELPHSLQCIVIL